MMRIVLVAITALYSAGLAVFGYFRFKRLGQLLEESKREREYVPDHPEEQKRAGRAKSDDPNWMQT